MKAEALEDEDQVGESEAKDTKEKQRSDQEKSQWRNDASGAVGDAIYARQVASFLGSPLPNATISDQSSRPCNSACVVITHVIKRQLIDD